MPINATGKKNKAGVKQYHVRINYTDEITGKYKRADKFVYGYPEALKVESELRANISSLNSDSVVTFEDLEKKYLKSHKSSVRETSYDARVSQLKISAPYFRKMKLSKITSRTIQEWKDEMQQRNVSLATKRNYYESIRSVFNYGKRLRYIQNNPMDNVPDFKDAYEVAVDEKLHYYTKEEFNKYISEAYKYANKINTITSWGIYVFFTLAYMTGGRKGEINALRWDDICENVMKIRRSITQKKKGGYVETPPKSKSSNRDIQLPQNVLDILAEHKKKQQALTGYNEKWYVCGGTSALSDTYIEKCNRKFGEAAGLPHIRIHDFRHSHASLLCNAGINIKEVARRLGHSDVTLTWSVYSHLYPKEEEKALNVLNEMDFTISENDSDDSKKE